MHIHSSLVLATLWLTAALAAPAPSGPEAGPEIKGRSFKVDRVRRSDHKRNGPLALRRAFKKYGWSVPPSVAKAAAQAGGGQTGEVPAQGERNDAEYLSPVNIGGQTLMLNFDTGSSDLYGPRCGPRGKTDADVMDLGGCSRTSCRWPRPKVTPPTTPRDLRASASSAVRRGASRTVTAAGPGASWAPTPSTSEARR